MLRQDVYSRDEETHINPFILGIVIVNHIFHKHHIYSRDRWLHILCPRISREWDKNLACPLRQRSGNWVRSYWASWLIYENRSDRIERCLVSRIFLVGKKSPYIMVTEYTQDIRSTMDGNFQLGYVILDYI